MKKIIGSTILCILFLCGCATSRHEKFLAELKTSRDEGKISEAQYLFLKNQAEESHEREKAAIKAAIISSALSSRSNPVSVPTSTYKSSPIYDTQMHYQGQAVSSGGRTTYYGADSKIKGWSQD